MRFLSVCSGIEAASVAWSPLGWKAWAFAEIDKFPCAVLAHHYPDTPNLGDMTGFKDWPDADISLLCGGTPCQSFSNAGLRVGLDDPRGQLMLTFGAIAARYRPRWLVWENVPGVLSSNGGRDFGAFLGLLGFLGYGFAYRVLDAQYVRVDGHGRAVPQRRNRVFVVGCLGDWRSAAAVLLERESLRGDPAPSRSAGARVAATLTRGAESSGKGGYAGRRQEDDVNIISDTLRGHIRPGSNTTGAIALCLNAKGGGGRLDAESETLIPTNGGVFDVAPTLTAQFGEQTGQDAMNAGLVAHTLRGEGFDASEDGTGRGTPIVPIAFDPTQITSRENRSNPQPGDPCHTLSKGMHAPAIAFDARQSDVIQYGDKAGPLDTDGSSQAIAFQERGRDGGRHLDIHGDLAYALTAPAGGGRSQEGNVLTPQMRVRRLMPVECERLQGFKDNYTLVPWRGGLTSDGVRYKALGNSWATNCARWVGRRIALVDSIGKAG